MNFYKILRFVISLMRDVNNAIAGIFLPFNDGSETENFLINFSFVYEQKIMVED